MDKQESAGGVVAAMSRINPPTRIIHMSSLLANYMAAAAKRFRWSYLYGAVASRYTPITKGGGSSDTVATVIVYEVAEVVARDVVLTYRGAGFFASPSALPPADVEVNQVGVFLCRVHMTTKVFIYLVLFNIN